MMTVVDTNDCNSHRRNSFVKGTITFPDQQFSSVFDCNTNNMVNTSCGTSNLNGCLGNDINAFDGAQNRLLLKHIRNRNTKDFKELVSNFWSPSSQNSNSFEHRRMSQNQGFKNSMPINALSRRLPSADSFGNFHPIELTTSNNIKKNNFANGKPNETMDMRISLQKTSSFGINKNLFRPSTNMGCSSNNGANAMAPSLTHSMLNRPSSRRVSVHDDSNQYHSLKHSTSAIINAATDILNENGNEFESIFGMNNSMGNVMNDTSTDPIPGRNVVSEPGPYDIVCGRNSGAYNYIGNRRFRVTIEMNLQRYIDSPTREDKTNVIKSIVWMLHEQVGARFLKKETFKKSGSGRKRGTPIYTVMSDKQAREKVGHALRDLVIMARKDQKEKQQPKEQDTTNSPQKS